MIWVIWKEKRSRLAKLIREDLQKLGNFSYMITKLKFLELLP